MIRTRFTKMGETFPVENTYGSFDIVPTGTIDLWGTISEELGNDETSSDDTVYFSVKAKIILNNSLDISLKDQLRDKQTNYMWRVISVARGQNSTEIMAYRTT